MTIITVLIILFIGVLYAIVPRSFCTSAIFLFLCSLQAKTKFINKSIEKTHMSRVRTNNKLSTFVPLTLYFSKFHLVIGGFCIKAVFTVIHP